MKQKVTPYGTITTLSQKFFLLNPQPVARDSCWDNGTYTFFVATMFDNQPKTIVTNCFVIEYSNDIGPIELAGTREAAVNVVEPADELYPMDEEEHYYTHLEEHLV
jgi:hypothetical protein